MFVQRTLLFREGGYFASVLFDDLEQDCMEKLILQAHFFKLLAPSRNRIFFLLHFYLLEHL